MIGSSGILTVDLILSAFFTVTISTLVSGEMFRAIKGAMNKNRLEAELESAAQQNSQVYGLA
ncbi:hypothetical protein RSSM_02149 [Rhodopirellula sallentina SM41]|uniref:Uncharacterized protein n=1 Tax=Rhodopirellula sallentina SM41 TaxID=1263870 RepID=M5U4N1_9BACT|nr:hypothetical protein RSSM_02149 [Rhodopirellula sallentina SM41]